MSTSIRPLLHLRTIADLHRQFQLDPSQHSLIAVLDFSQVTEQVPPNTGVTTDFYAIMYKNYCKNHIRYGRKTIDFQEGSLICIAPNQTIEIDTEVEDRPNKMGWGLFFHPELIRASPLHDQIKQYSFFHYDITEALHLSEKEQYILFDCIGKIQGELQENIDVHSQQIMVSTLGLLLNYCSRFYDRQFITRGGSDRSVVTQIDALLTAYFANQHAQQHGLPTVAYLANQLHLSASYLSDLLKKQTGKTTQEHIHYHIVEAAKNSLLHSNKTVSEIAFELGFEYPQYFNKLFKKKVGTTPLGYRKLH